MTPVPLELDKDEEVLDRIVKAVDGKTDQGERRKAFIDQERKAFQELSGVDDKSWRVSFLRGYPALFLCFTGPRIKNEEEPKPPIEASLDAFLSSLSADVVYGDTGCRLNGVSFSGRAQWTVTDEKKPKTAVSATSAEGVRDTLVYNADPVEDSIHVGQPPAIVGPILAVAVVVAVLITLMVLLA
jgi:hypothetical protein